MGPQQQLEKVGARMAEAGYEVTPSAVVGGTPALVGHTSEFRWQWMATRLHLLVCVQTVDTVTADALERFTQASLEHALASKGALRGFQVGVAAAPVLIGARVDDGARHYAEHRLVRRYGAFAWPVAIDASTGQVHRHTGRPKIGGIYAAWMREQIDAVTLGA